MNNRNRSSKPKVRTGCMTCKTRRVKCDESRPSCRRCEKAGFQCQGYPAVPPRANAAGTKTLPARLRDCVVGQRLLLPRPGLGPSNQVQESRPLTLVRDPPVLSFADGDRVYFDYFRCKAAYDLSGYANLGFWSELVVSRAVWDEPVREAILAIAALSRALGMEDKQDESSAGREVMAPLHPSNGKAMNEDHRNALRHHNYAVAMFQRRLQDRDAPDWVSSILIMTILIIGFELMQGAISTADGIMRCSIQLLSGSFTTIRPVCQTESKERQYENHGIDDIEFFLPCLSLMSGYTYGCKSQHDLFTTFVPPQTARDIPSDEEILKDALIKWGRFYTRCMLFVTHTTRNRLDLSAMEEEQFRLLVGLRKWNDFLRKLRLNAEASQSPDLRMEILTMQRLACTVLVNSCMDDTEMTYDNFGTEFEEINNSCARFLEASPAASRTPFSFTGGDFMSCLSLVVSKCRYLEPRKRAVKIFKRVHWREGTWDRAAILCNLGQVDLEDQGRDSVGRIASEARWVWTNTDWDYAPGQVRAEYTRVGSVEAGLPVRVRIPIDVR